MTAGVAWADRRWVTPSAGRGDRPSRLRLAGWVAAVIAWAPALVLLVLLVSYAVNVPFWDEWFFGDLIVRRYERGLTLADVFAYHNEHRPVVPRVMFLVLSAVAGWRPDVQMFLNFACVVGAAALFARVEGLARRDGAGRGWAVVLLSNVVLFSPVQHENWLWAFQTPLALSVLGVSVGVWAIASAKPFRLRLAAALGAGAVMTLCLASGPLAFGVFAPVLLTGPNRRSRVWATGFWLAAFAAAVWFYSDVGAHRPPGQPPLGAFLRQPVRAGVFGCSYLGGALNVGWGELPERKTAVCGLAACGVLAASLAVLWRRGRLRRPTTVAWCALAAYAVGTAVLTTSGRLHTGLGRSLDSRYALFSACFLIATAHLVREALQSDGTAAGRVASVKEFGAALWGAAVALGVAAGVAALPAWREVYEKRLVGRAALRFALSVPDRAVIGRYLFFEKAWEPFYRDIDVLDRLGYFTPGVLRIKSMAEIEGPRGKAAGHVDVLARQNDEAEGAYGWAVLTDRLTAPDVVVLSYRDVAGDEVPFTIVDDVRRERPDIAAGFGTDRVRRCGWQKSILIGLVPRESPLVTAWAYDGETGKAYRVGEPMRWVH